MPGAGGRFLSTGGLPARTVRGNHLVVRHVGDVLRVSDGDFRAEMIDAGIPDHSVDVVFH